MHTDDTLTLGMDSEAFPSDAQATVSTLPQAERTGPDAGELRADSPDHFVVQNGECFAGRHLIIDVWDAHGIDDVDHVRTTLERAAREAGATLLHTHFHHFTPNGGVTGVAVLAESHISIHSWPERGYAALDVFMCGDSEPERAVEVLREAFTPHRLDVQEHVRGRMPADA
ncbi:S-adenosylmethionine decarboxylase [Limimonas halophila]|uniref:S-adenosylmethionine decarboxylase proenzyme n=1 Tax=Limimonas halophila TaxID=1082479 RepID=A0A1G7R6Q3_9PROT|nr:adenosylmethionine decarboxylase [Limimonas halophila]SDG06462.1 S-adenosylmethionine decarboxylase [Limimonas halophila]